MAVRTSHVAGLGLSPLKHHLSVDIRCEACNRESSDRDLSGSLDRIHESHTGLSQPVPLFGPHHSGADTAPMMTCLKIHNFQSGDKWRLFTLWAFPFLYACLPVGRLDSFVANP